MTLHLKIEFWVRTTENVGNRRHILCNQAWWNMSGGHCWPRQSVSGWHGAAGLSGLGENNRRHTRTEKAPGKNKLLTHTRNSAPLKHARNVVRLETSTLERLPALTRHDFHKWVNPSNTQIPDSRRDRWPARLPCSRRAELSCSQ